MYVSGMMSPLVSLRIKKTVARGLSKPVLRIRSLCHVSTAKLQCDISSLHKAVSPVNY